MIFERVKNHLFFVVFMFILLILSICVSNVNSVPFITKKFEIDLGKSADKDVINQYGLYEDKSLQVYLNDIGQKLVSKLTNKEFSQFYFKLLDSSEINAFALPGGYIYVTRGLLAALNSEDELASVLGHEISHVTAHHGAKSMVRAIGAQILSIGGAIAVNETQLIAISGVLFQQINLGYGREAELEADAQGMLNALDAGYHPAGMVNFLKNLRKQEIMGGQSYHSFQASHPETKERIIKAGLISSSLSKNINKINEMNNIYFSKLMGLVYGGKKSLKDKRRYKSKYLDIYTVQKGDTLEDIAIKELGDKRYALGIAVINGIKETAPIKPNLMLKIVKNGVYKRDKLIKISPNPDS